MVRRGNGVLPDQLLRRDFRTEITRKRAHVAVGELEPRAGKRVSELIRMLEEAPGDLLVDRIDPQREVRDQHRWRMTLRRVEGIRNWRGAAFRLPLIGAGRAPGQLPFIAEQVLEVVVAPLRWRLRPGNFRAAGDRGFALAIALTARREPVRR